MSWQLIETAEKIKGNRILAYRVAGDAYWVVYWYSENGFEGWRIVGTNTCVSPTHWKPLEPPEGKTPIASGTMPA